MTLEASVMIMESWQYYTNITIMLLEWTHNLEHHSRSVKDDCRDVIYYRNILNVFLLQFTESDWEWQTLTYYVTKSFVNIKKGWNLAPTRFSPELLGPLAWWTVRCSTCVGSSLANKCCTTSINFIKDKRLGVSGSSISAKKEKKVL